MIRKILGLIQSGVIAGFAGGLALAGAAWWQRLYPYARFRMFRLLFHGLLAPVTCWTVAGALAAAALWGAWRLASAVPVRGRASARGYPHGLAAALFLFLLWWILRTRPEGLPQWRAALAVGCAGAWALLAGACAARICPRSPARHAGAAGALAAAFLAVTALANLALALDARLNAPATPNVILITIETLRTDHLGCFGYARDTSPRIDAFRRGATLCTQAITPRAKTVPSVVTIMTSQYPHTHGVRDNWWEMILPGTITLAEVLQEAGYRTAAFVGNWVLTASNSRLDKGFDLYDDRMQRSAVFPDLIESTGDVLTGKAVRWLRGRREHERFFLWVHYQDPHGPYYPPERYRMFSHEGSLPVPLADILEYQRLPDVPVRDGMVDGRAYVDRYDGEIRFCDAEIGALLDSLRERGLYDGSLVIILADHGESLLEHRYYFEHGKYVYDDSVRIPLLVKLPGQKDAGTVERQVSTLCVAPTILDLLGLPSPMPQEGASLLPLIRGGESGVSPYVFLENRNKVKGVRTGEWKYIENHEEGRTELYHLPSDPGETVNVIGKHPEVAGRLREELHAWMNASDALGRREAQRGDAPPEAMRALRALGYMQ